jgi:mannose-6-phosphate isomerase-like protein (cupin superfamily)
MIEIINKHIDEGKAVHIKKGIQPFGWDVVVKHLRECADEIYAGTPNGTLSYQLNQAEEIEDVKKVIEYLNKDMTLKIFDAHIFTSFTTKKKAVAHTDNHNVLLWAITGNMTINLLDDIDSEECYYTEELKPGDIVYIPADMPHRIDAQGERALVSFGIEVEEGVKYNSPVTNPYTKKDGNNES